MAPTRKLASLYYELRAHTSQFDQDLRKVERGFGKLTDYVLKNPVQAIGAVGTAMLGVAIKAARLAAEVDQAMRRVQASVKGSAEGFKQLRTDIEAMSLATGRSQAELAGAAAEIAKSVGTVAEVGQRLNAALLLSQGTGEELTGVINGLDQVMDAFGISAEHSAETVGKLYAAAKNRQPITDLFAAIQAAAPALVQMGLDLDTGTRALSALIDQGLSARQAGREFKALAELGAEGAKRIQELADALPEATDGLNDLARAADSANDSTWNLSKRLAAGLAAPLIALGKTILPGVNAFLQANVTLVEALTGRYQSAADAAKEFSDASKGAIPTGPNAPITITARGGLTADDIRKQQEARKRAVEEAAKAVARAARTAAEAEALFKRATDAMQKHADDVARAAGDVAKLEADGLRALALASGDTVAVIDMELAGIFARIREAGKIAGLTDDQMAAAFANATAHLRAAREAATALNGALAKIEISSELREKLTTPLQKIGREVDQLREKLVKAGASQEEIAKATTQRAVERLTAMFQQQGFTLDDARQRAEAYIGTLGSVESATAKLADSIAEIGNAVLSVAGALGVVDQQTQSLGRGLLNVAAGLGTGKPLTVIAGVGDIISSLFGGRRAADDPEARRRTEILEENNRRLAELRDRLGELVSVTASGRDIGAIAGVTTRQRTTTGGVSGFEEIEFFRPSEDVIADLRKAGVSLEELRKVAEDFGITLSESPSITELEALQQAIRDFQFGAFVESFSSQLSALETGFRLFDITDPIDQAERFLALLTDPKIGAPAIAEALAGFDLTTAGGIEQARAALQGIFEQLTSGALTAEEFEALLGGLTIDEFLQALGFLDDALDKATASALSAGQVFDLTFGRLQLRRGFGELSTDDFLTGLIEAFGEGFADAASQIDFATLPGFKATAGALIDSFFADGELTDQEREQIRVLEILLGAYEEAAAGALSLANTLSTAFQDIDLDAAIFGESLEDTFNKKFSRIIAGLPAAPGTGGFTPGGAFDLSTQAGRDEARAALQALAISQPDLRPIIAELIGDLDRLPEIIGEEVGEAVGNAVGKGTSVSAGIQQLTVFQGDRLITLGESKLLRLTQIRDLIAGAQATRGQFLQPPSLASFGAAGAFANNGGTSLSIVQNVTVSVPAGTTDPQMIANATAQASINRLLADGMVRERFFSGSNRAL